MTPIHNAAIHHPMAWHGADLAKDDIAFDLSARHAAGLEDILARVQRAGLELGEIRAEDCRHPALDNDFAQIFEQIQDGRGIVILRGIPVADKSPGEVGAIFWAIGSHFGRGVSQSARGDLLGLVQDETPPGESESARGYTSKRELSLHVDLAQIVGLMCVRQAPEGGLSQFASGLAVHNAILANRPDLLPILYRGFPYHRRGEEAAHHHPITPYDIPVFSQVDGQISVFLVREIINAAFRDLGRSFTAEEIDAIDTFRATARRLQFETRLEPGEASFINNYTIMHARSEFVDEDRPEHKRLMLRLWLDAERKRRPVVREIHIYENEGGRSGIDPQPGRLPAEARYRTPDELVRPVAAAST